jgi:hypothetical protein
MQGNKLSQQRKWKAYLDTSVINFLFTDDTPDKKSITQEFFKVSAKQREFELFISDVVLFEINNTPDPQKRAKLLSIQQMYPIQMVSIDHMEIQVLAQTYINEGIIPKRKVEDAQHIAIPTYHRMDFLISWNLRHIANPKKSRKITEINKKMKYKHTIRLCTPGEVIL